MKLVKISVLGGAVAAALVMGSAQATGSNTVELQSAVTVPTKCTNLAAPKIEFPAYDPDAVSDTTQTTTVTVRCTKGSVFSINASAGNSGNSGQRQLHSTATDQLHTADLNYNLYVGSSSTVWDETDSGKLSGTGAGLLADNLKQSFTVTGKITKGQDVPDGEYKDTVIVTVTY